MTALIPNRTLQTFLILFLAVLVFLGRQLDVGLSNYDDAYYAQKAKEMLTAESLWTPTFYHEPAFDNPPLPFWLTALAYKVFGVSGYAAAFFPALFGAGIMVLTYRMALYLYRDDWIALASVFVLLFPGLFVDSARRAMVDIPLAFFVTAAMFCFARAWENKKYYLLFGLATAGGVLTKSLLGFFPLVVGAAFCLLARKWKDVSYLVSGYALALVLGSSWYGINWMKYGDDFLQFHFGYIIMGRGFSESGSRFYFLGYAKDFLRNYWPWLPIAVAGLAASVRKGFRERDENALLLFLWVIVILAVMSVSKTQTLRYILMIFPALAIITAKTLAGWLTDRARERCLPYMMGIVLFLVLFVNVTPLQVKVTLGQNSRDVRQLADVINLNTPEGEKVGNYRLSQWNPRNSLLFYADRLIGDPVTQSGQLIEQMERRPEDTWLTALGAFRELEQLYPGKFYLIQANGDYVYFTSASGRERVRYDFSGRRIPSVR